MQSERRDAAPIDYWREVARRGVMAVGFSLVRAQNGAWMSAELVAPQEGPVQRAAHAAIEVHKLIELEPGTAAHDARQHLAARLETGPAIRELAIYQGLLLERLWRDIKEAPAACLARLALPSED